MDADQLKQVRSIEHCLALLPRPEYQTRRIAIRHAELIAVYNRIQELFMMQANPHLRGGQGLKLMRDALRKNHINPISADGMLYLDGEPGIKDLLRLPHKSVADKTLVDEALRIIRNAKPYADTFVEKGYDPDFIEKAEQAVAEFRERSSQPDEKVAKRGYATSALPDVILKGRKIIKSITKLVETELARDKGTVTQWKHAARIPATLGRPKDNFRGRRTDAPDIAEGNTDEA
jgi:hypothetical protein